MLNTIKIHPASFIAALSSALELTSTGISRHHHRTAIIARHFGSHLKMNQEESQVLIYAALLHDIGAAANWNEKHYIIHATDRFQIFNHAEHGYDILRVSRQLKALAEPVRHHHDWFSGQNPSGCSGQAIPLASRIIHLADRIEVLIDNSRHIFAQRDAIMQEIMQTPGQFDPDLLDVFAELGCRDIFWLDIINQNQEKSLFNELSFFGKYFFEMDDLILIAGIFAQIVDSASPYTASHSQNVARVAQHLALARAFCEEEAKQFYLAGLVHDLGKLAIPNAILNKPGPLTREEREIVKQHSYYSQRILEQVEGFATIARWIGTHHETLDGKGYPYRLDARSMELGSRILAVADVFSALIENRPYRNGMNPGAAMIILEDMAQNHQLDGRIIQDVRAYIENLLPLVRKV